MAVCARAQTRLVQQKRKRHKDAAANDKGEHVRNAVHEVLVDPTTQPLGFALGSRLYRGAAGHMMNRSIARKRNINKLLGVINATRHRTGVNRLAIEAIELDIFIRRNDDTPGTSDVRRGQHIFSAARTLSFDLNAHAHLGCLILQTFGRHKRVRNARRARRDRNHVVCPSPCFLIQSRHFSSF